MFRWPCRTPHPSTASRMRAQWPTRFALLALALSLGACASLPGTLGSQDSAVVERVQSAERMQADGDFAGAAAGFLALSRAHRGDASAYYRLRAAEALRDGGDIEGAERALGDIKRRRLHEDEPQRLDLLDAEIALHRGDIEHARALLTFDARPFDPSPYLPKIRVRVDLVHGSDDDVIPFEHAARLAAQLVNARVHVSGMAGHTGTALPSPRAIARELATMIRILDVFAG